ncbi:hypothetical protein [Pseudomonas sp. PA15(2017)]|uniref:hypothetical protein n=1 Tax=Pseudomonas sp. PA15(2017) TaxID=1932111 RepID=UPI001438AAD3|nr:hypothetical protein [Pseudomonas sp. PA15(2017)]
MVVAMVAVRVMQVSIDEIVHMIAMGNGLMAAARSMHMIRSVSATLVIRRAGIRVLGVYFQAVFVHMITVRMMQVTIVQVVDMTIVLDGQMATARLVLMIVMGMLVAVAHGAS